MSGIDMAIPSSFSGVDKSQKEMGGVHLVHHDGSVDSCSIHPELSGNPKTSSTFSAPCPAVRLSFDVTVSLVTVAMAAQDQGGMRPRQEGRLDSLNRTTAAPPLCSLGLKSTRDRTKGIDRPVSGSWVGRHARMHLKVTLQ